MNEDDRAQVLLHEGLVLSRELGDTGGIAYALNWLGWVAMDEDKSSAKLYLEQAEVLWRALDQPFLLYDPIFGLGNYAMNSGDLALAKSRFLECLERCRVHGDRWFSALPSHRLGQVEALLGNPDTARALFEDSLAIWREFDDRGRAGRVLSHLAALYLDIGDPEAARKACEEVLDLSRGAGRRRDFVYNLVTLGLVAVDLGDYTAARARLLESRALRSLQLVDTAFISLWLTAAIGLAAAQGHHAVAARLAGSLTHHTPSRMAPWDEARLQRWLEPARQAFGNERTAALWAEGEAMSLLQAFTSHNLDS
jgi:tetratricopeptide (TPR) repeat protein